MSFNYKSSNFLSTPTEEDKRIRIFDKNKNLKYSIEPEISFFNISGNCVIIKMLHKIDIKLSFENKNDAIIALDKLSTVKSNFTTNNVLNGLTDVSINNPVNGNTLIYSGNTWENQSVSSTESSYYGSMTSHYGNSIKQSKLPLTIINDDQYGTSGWTNASNIIADDGNYATYSGSTAPYYLKATNFEFDIPNGSTITEITVWVRYNNSGLTESGGEEIITNVKAFLVKSGDTQSSDGFDDEDYMSYEGLISYQPITSALWGDTWTLDDISNPYFGVVFSAFASETGEEIGIDAIFIEIMYNVNYGTELSSIDWHKIDHFNSNGLSNGVTPDYINNKLTINQNGIYKISLEGNSITSYMQDSYVSVGIYINGVVYDTLIINVAIFGGVSYDAPSNYQISVSDIIELSENDEIEIYAKNNIPILINPVIMFEHVNLYVNTI